ncbi:MAG: nuclear transport factor 2 family protein [Bacteroidetes bacterium]|nr:nuclear transport factor 2 family protein [Bacteroidota bacterium]
MKKYLYLFIFLFSANLLSAQANEQTGVERACLDYIEGFYQGDTAKIIRSLSPDLLKFGYFKNKETGAYESQGQMTFEEALTYSRNVLIKERFVSPEAPKKVEILDIGNHIASAKVTAWWGIDYILLAKEGDRWIIQQVLWEGPYVPEG